MAKDSTKFPVPHRIAVVKATRAENDEQLLQLMRCGICMVNRFMTNVQILRPRLRRR
jgi:hypothetical protein